MAIQRKHIPEPVIWDQTSILREIAKLRSQLAQLTTLTGDPASDTRGTVVREVRAEEIISALIALPEVLERIHSQLAVLTGVQLEPGEHI